jgi:hypothetical protein
VITRHSTTIKGVSMNRTWITGLTLATVAGTGAAFTGVVVNSHDTQAKAEALTPVVPQALVRVEPTATTSTTPGRTLSYQVGAAGAATLTIANGSLNVDNATASPGWVLATSSGPGTHIDVQFSDGTQLVTFGADLVGTDVVVVSLTNAPDPAAVVATVPPTTVTVANTAAPTLGQTTAQPKAARPPATVAPAAPAPPKAATTAPSGSGSTGNDDGAKESNDD